MIGALTAAARAAARSSAAAISSGVGSVTTTSPAASTITVCHSANDASPVPTTVTMPFSLARIAVCEVGPPSVVTTAST